MKQEPPPLDLKAIRRKVTLEEHLKKITVEPDKESFSEANDYDLKQDFNNHQFTR